MAWFDPATPIGNAGLQLGHDHRHPLGRKTMKKPSALNWHIPRWDPIRQSARQADLTLAYLVSLVVALVMAVASVAGLVFGSARLYGVARSTAGVLVPGFLA